MHIGCQNAHDHRSLSNIRTSARSSAPKLIGMGQKLPARAITCSSWNFALKPFRIFSHARRPDFRKDHAT